VRINTHAGRGGILEAVDLPDDPIQVNTDTLHARCHQALSTNAAFLALASPTNAQTLAQVKVLTRECTALIRLLLNQVDDITGT